MSSSKLLQVSILPDSYDVTNKKCSTVVISSSENNNNNNAFPIRQNSEQPRSSHLFDAMKQETSTLTISHASSSPDGKLLALATSSPEQIRIYFVSDLLLTPSPAASSSSSDRCLVISNNHHLHSKIQNLQFSKGESRIIQTVKQEIRHQENNVDIIATTTSRKYLLASTCQNEGQIWGVESVTIEEEMIETPTLLSSQKTDTVGEKKKTVLTASRKLLLINNTHDDDEQIQEPLGFMRGHGSYISSISFCAAPTILYGGLFDNNKQNNNDETNSSSDDDLQDEENGKIEPNDDEEQDEYFVHVMRSSSSISSPHYHHHIQYQKKQEKPRFQPQLVASSSADESIRIWKIGSSIFEPMRKTRKTFSSEQQRRVSLFSICIGHNAFVSSVSFSLDGMSLASGGEGDCAIRLWSPWDGQPKLLPHNNGKNNNNDDSPLLLIGHKSFVNFVAFSPVSEEGLILVSSSLDKTIRVWNTILGTQLFAIYPLTDSANLGGNIDSSWCCSSFDFCFLRNNYGNNNHSNNENENSFVAAILAHYGNSGLMRLWNSKNGNFIREIQQNINDGNESTSSSSYCLIHVDPQQIQSNNRAGETENQMQSRSASYLSQSTLLSSSTNIHHNLRSISALSDASSIAKRSNSIVSNFSNAAHQMSNHRIPLVFSTKTTKKSSSSLLRTGTRLVDARSGICMSRPLLVDHIQNQEHDYIYQVAFAPSSANNNNNFIATAHADGHIRFWNLNNKNNDASTRAFKLSKIKHGGKVRSVNFSQDGRFLVSASEDHSVRVWDLFLKESGRNNNNNNLILPKKFSTNDDRSDDDDRNHDGLLVGHTSYVYCATFSHGAENSAIVASCSHDKTVRIWDSDSGKQLFVLTGHTKDVICVQFSPSNPYLLASCSHDKTIRVWDLGSFVEKQLHQHNPTSLHRYPPMEGHTSYINTLAFSPNGKFLVSAGDDKTIRFWNVRTGKSLQVFHTNEAFALAGIHSSWIYSLSFSPCGNLLASSSRDRTICLWKVDEIIATSSSNEDDDNISSPSSPSIHLTSMSPDLFLKAAPLFGHLGRVRSVCFSNSSSNMMASAGADGTIRFWSIPATLSTSSSSSSSLQNSNDNNIYFSFQQQIHNAMILRDARLVGKDKSFVALTFSGVNNNNNNSSEMKVFPWRPQYEHQFTRPFIEVQELISWERIQRFHLEISQLHHHRRIALLNHQINCRYELMLTEVFEAEKIFRISREASSPLGGAALLWWVQLEERQDRIRIRTHRYIDFEMGERRWIWLQFLSLNPLTLRERLIASQPQQQQQPNDPASANSLLTARVNGPEVVVRRGRTVLLRLRGHLRSVTCGAFSTDGLALVTASGVEHRMMLWRISDGRLATDYRVVRHPKQSMMNEVGWSCENTLIWSRDEDGNVCGYQIYGRKLKFNNSNNNQGKITPLATGPCVGCGTRYATAPKDWKCTVCNYSGELISENNSNWNDNNNNNNSNSMSPEKPLVAGGAPTTTTSPGQTASPSQQQQQHTMCLFCGTDFSRQAASAKIRCSGCSNFICEKCVAVQNADIVWNSSQNKNKKNTTSSTSSASALPVCEYSVCYDCVARCCDLPPHVSADDKKRQQLLQKENEKIDKTKKEGKIQKIEQDNATDDDDNDENQEKKNSQHKRSISLASSAASTVRTEAPENQQPPQNQVAASSSSPAVTPPKKKISSSSSVNASASSIREKQQSFLIQNLTEILQLSDAVSTAIALHRFDWMNHSLKDCCEKQQSSSSTTNTLTKEASLLLLKQVQTQREEEQQQQQHQQQQPNEKKEKDESKNAKSADTLDSVSVGIAVASSIRSLRHKVRSLDSTFSEEFIKKMHNNNTNNSNVSKNSETASASSSLFQLQQQNFLIEKHLHAISIPLSGCLSVLQTTATMICRLTANFKPCQRLLSRFVLMQGPIVRFAVSNFIAQYFSTVYNHHMLLLGSPQKSTEGGNNNNNFFFSSRDSQSSAGSRRSSNLGATTTMTPPKSRNNNNANDDYIAEHNQHQLEKQQRSHQRKQEQVLLFEKNTKILHEFENRLTQLAKDGVGLCKKFSLPPTSAAVAVGNDKQEDINNSNNQTKHHITLLNKLGTLYYALLMNEIKFSEISEQTCLLFAFGNTKNNSNASSSINLDFSSPSQATSSATINNSFSSLLPHSIREADYDRLMTSDAPSPSSSSNSVSHEVTNFSSSVFNLQKHEQILKIVFPSSSSSSASNHRHRPTKSLLHHILFDSNSKEKILYDLRQEQTKVAEKMMGVCLALSLPPSNFASIFSSPTSSAVLTLDENTDFGSILVRSAISAQQQSPNAALPLIILPRSSVTFGGRIGNPGEFSYAKKSMIHGVPVVVKTYTKNAAASSGNGKNSSSQQQSNNNSGITSPLLDSAASSPNNLNAMMNNTNNNNQMKNLEIMSNRSVDGFDTNNNNNDVFYRKLAAAEFRMLKKMLLQHNNDTSTKRYNTSRFVHPLAILDDQCSVVLEYLGDSLTMKLEKYWVSVFSMSQRKYNQLNSLQDDHQALSTNNNTNNSQRIRLSTTNFISTNNAANVATSSSSTSTNKQNQNQTPSLFSTSSSISKTFINDGNGNPSSSSGNSSPIVVKRGELINYDRRIARERDNVAAFRVTISLLLAVVDLHAESIFHRDLKPSNIFFCLKGSAETAIKLVDFAHAVLPASTSSWHARVSTFLQRKEFEKMRHEEQEKYQIQQPEEFNQSLNNNNNVGNNNTEMFKGLDRISMMSTNSDTVVLGALGFDEPNNNNNSKSSPRSASQTGNIKSSNKSDAAQQQAKILSTIMKPLPALSRCDDNLFYAPPESFRNFLNSPTSVANPSSSEEASADMFSLGIVLIELWTRRRAYHCYEKVNHSQSAQDGKDSVSATIASTSAPKPPAKTFLDVNNNNNLNTSTSVSGAVSLNQSTAELDEQEEEEMYCVANPPSHDELVKMKLTGMTPFPTGMMPQVSQQPPSPSLHLNAASHASSLAVTPLSSPHMAKSNSTSASTTPNSSSAVAGAGMIRQLFRRKFPLSVIRRMPPVIIMLVSALCSFDPSVRPTARFVRDQLVSLFSMEEESRLKSSKNNHAENQNDDDASPTTSTSSPRPLSENTAEPGSSSSSTSSSTGSPNNSPTAQGKKSQRRPKFNLETLSDELILSILGSRRSQLDPSLFGVMPSAGGITSSSEDETYRSIFSSMTNNNNNNNQNNTQREGNSSSAGSSKTNQKNTSNSNNNKSSSSQHSNASSSVANSSVQPLQPSQVSSSLQPIQPNQPLQPNQHLQSGHSVNVSSNSSLAGTPVVQPRNPANNNNNNNNASGEFNANRSTSNASSSHHTAQPNHENDTKRRPNSNTNNTSLTAEDLSQLPPPIITVKEASENSFEGKNNKARNKNDAAEAFSSPPLPKSPNTRGPGNSDVKQDRNNNNNNNNNNNRDHDDEQPRQPMQPILPVQPLQPAELLKPPSFTTTVTADNSTTTTPAIPPSNTMKSKTPMKGSSTTTSSSSSWMKNIDIDDETKLVLKKERVDEKTFLMLDENDLKQMGIPLGPRKILLQEIQERKTRKEMLKKTLVL